MINKIKEMFSENDDLVIRKVKINFFHSIYVIFFDTLVNQDKINEYILKRITSVNKLHNFENEVPGMLLKLVHLLTEVFQLMK